MDTLPVETLFYIFAYLPERPIEIIYILSARKVCKLFWKFSIDTALWRSWGLNVCVNKFHDQPLYKTIFFQYRLFQRYCALMGCYDPRIRNWSKEKLIESFAIRLYFTDKMFMPFISTKFPLHIYKKREIYKLLEYEIQQDGCRGRNLEQLKDLVTTKLRDGYMLRTNEAAIIFHGKGKIPNVNDVWDCRKRSKKLIKFGFFKVEYAFDSNLEEWVKCN